MYIQWCVLGGYLVCVHGVCLVPYRGCVHGACLFEERAGVFVCLGWGWGGDTSELVLVSVCVDKGDVLRECACYGCVPCKAGVSGLPLRLQRSGCCACLRAL